MTISTSCPDCDGAADGCVMCNGRGWVVPAGMSLATLEWPGDEGLDVFASLVAVPFCWAHNDGGVYTADDRRIAYCRSFWGHYSGECAIGTRIMEDVNR